MKCSTAICLACCLGLIGTTAAQAQVTVDFPLGIGLHIPAYDRVDGLSLPLGPAVSVGDDRLVLEPLLTYRSHLGKIDPALTTTLHVDSVLALSLTGARGSFSNDAWIRSNLINSAYALGLGVDARDYFRSDRAEGRVTLTIPWIFGSVGLYSGTRFENSWSTGWRTDELHGPFSFFGRRDSTNGIERPNPSIDPGHIASVIAGVRDSLDTDRESLNLHVDFEGAWHTPTATTFHQITVDGMSVTHTIGDEQLDLAVHAVTSWGGAAPPQRYAYVGGSGTLATINLLALGGDHMYFLDAVYVIPLPGPGIDLPLLGTIFIAPHFAAGAGSVGGFGPTTQNIGGRLGVGFLRIDYLVNPRTHQQDLGAGLAFSR